MKMTALKIEPQSALKRFSSEADYVSIRKVREKTRNFQIRNDKSEYHNLFIDEGVMFEVLINGHFGYAGTSDLSDSGLKKAFDIAKSQAVTAAKFKLYPMSQQLRPTAKGEYQSYSQRKLDSLSLQEIYSQLFKVNAAMKIAPEIINRSCSTMLIETEVDFVASNGSEVHQKFDMVSLDVKSTAAQGSDSQSRSINGMFAISRQMGLEIFSTNELLSTAEQAAKESLELLKAPNCPTEDTDLILMPDQMLLQIHESIGHPLEIDRILGDERNYAGWSFVKKEDFGQLQYGSKLLNVVFEPEVKNALASYQFDDSGHKATREYLIREGKLQRGLGSLESQARSNIPGVANFRSASWNRAPIDRMANINIEPGSTSLEDMIANVENGLLMTANRSWSIDDYRNKFQFGCEFARRITNGKLGEVLKNPNYHGTTVDFWNRLKMVGNTNTVEIFGSPWCGKGEPNQVIRVGHASPPCLFEKVSVFGGQS